MCKQPFTIPNPLRNSAQVSVGRFTPNVNNPYIQLYKDTTAQYIAVPCGHCAECRRIKQLGLITRVKFESLVNYVYFFTLTYNSNIPYISIPGFDENFYYADYSDIQKMFKRIRKNNLIGRPFKYLVVREYGKKGRPHFHGLLFVQSLPSDDRLFKFSLETKLYKLILDNWQRNEGSNRSPDYVNLTTYRYVYRFGRANYNYDLHLVQPDDRCKDDAKFDSEYNVALGSSVSTLSDKMYIKQETPTTSPNNTSKMESLLELKKLLDSGILTQEEFDNEKKKILNS